MSDRRKFLEDFIFRSLGHERFNQSSPILPDVWLAYGLNPGQPQDLLLAPHIDSSPHILAQVLRDRLQREKQLWGYSERKRWWKVDPDVAYNQTSVVVKLYFHELIRVALPLSAWWHLGQRSPLTREEYENSLEALINPKPYQALKEINDDLVWLSQLIGMIEIANWHVLESNAEERPQITLSDMKQWAEDTPEIVRRVEELLGDIDPVSEEHQCILWSVNRNRPSTAAVKNSLRTIKADACQRAFRVTGRNICWAVLDSGIDARHPAFCKDPNDWVGTTRIRATYDFTQIRKLLSADPRSLQGLPPSLLEKASALGIISDLRKALLFGRDIDWDLIMPLLEVEHDEDKYVLPPHHHGTHVAGIMAADWEEENMKGICPEIELYDMRVLGENAGGDEFSIMAALQFIRYLNLSNNLVRDLMQVHGANLSFSLNHDVANYACGRTPVCEECERLVNSGVVVAAAAGNQGRVRYTTTSGAVDEGYRPMSITDPGNADAVITVGATHRRDPHTFGVSYFSSRGPTGDGRRKPDLLAPGERITSTMPNEDKGELDGTSMAAPHVSGAAALLMERHSEFIGRPYEVKRVLCETATDLGREPEFQGAGLVDILRALQSV